MVSLTVNWHQQRWKNLFISFRSLPGEQDKKNKIDIVDKTVLILLLNLLELTPTCPTFQGPLSNACLDAIWRQKGCVGEGDQFPGNMPTMTKLNEWKNFNI